MALRFRFHLPWGLLLAVSAFAALGAAAAFALLTDFHGQLLTRVVLAAVGAGLLGAAGWVFSERLADTVNLHTSPFLRLAFPGLAALFLCTEVAGAFSELGVGTGAVWPEILSSLLYLPVGLPPLLAGIALIAGLETALAARRGGSGVYDALRPIAGYLALATALGGATVYASVRLPQEVLRWTVAAAPDRVRASGWLQREKRLFMDAHRNWTCDVLVVPFSSAAPSVDRVARSLMTRYVSAELAVRSGLCVADPTLVARALGARTRAIDQADVRKLADAMHAGWIVRGAVALEAGRQAFSVALRAERRDTPNGPWRGGQDLVWGPIEFSDELPPEAAFGRIARAAAEQLGVPMQDAQAPGDTGDVGAVSNSAEGLPGSPAGLAGAVHTALTRARGLQLLAAIYHPPELGAEHLWERSLVALSALPTEEENARVLRARANLHLHRRPYALELLKGQQSAEARTLRALVQGNLSDAEQLAGEVTDATATLTLELELEALRARYGRTARHQERRRALLDTHPGYAALLYVPLSHAESFQPAAHERIRKALSEAGVEVSDALVHLLRARIHVESRIEADGPATAAAIELGYAPLWRKQASAWRTERAFDRVATWDAYDALYAANRAALVRSARAVLSNPAEASALPGLVNALGIAYAGHPALEASVAVALRGANAGALGNASAAAPDALAKERVRRLPVDVLAWESGETDVERELRARIPRALPAPDADEPPRAWRTVSEWQAGGSEPASGQNASLEQGAAHYTRMQEYASDGFSPLEQAIALQERLGQREQAARLEQEAVDRFVGDPARERYLLQRAEDKGDVAAYVALLQQKTREQPDQWPIYPRLASAYLRLREPALAQQAMLAYPAFQPVQATAAAPEPSSISGPASEAGMLLLAAGEADLSRPLFALAATRAPDSVAGMWSRLSLAQIEGNWREARAEALELHERFQAEGALPRAASLSFALGEHEAGWRGFYEAAKRFEDFTPWAAALDGHRAEATKPDELIAFTKRWKSLSGERVRETRLKSYFLFNILMVDRPVSDNAVQTLETFAAQREDDRLGPLAAGYRAFKRGDYAGAADRFGALREAGEGQPRTATDATDYLLPYVALALAQSGRATEAEGLLQSVRKPGTQNFHYLLAMAYVAGSGGRGEAALNVLWDAFLALPPRSAAMIPPGFQLLEACERLHALTRDDRYRVLLVQLARRQQSTWPVSWAYAFEARHGAQPEEVERALGMALFLDPQSEHLQAFGPDQRKRATERFVKNHPFGRG